MLENETVQVVLFVLVVNIVLFVVIFEHNYGFCSKIASGIANFFKHCMGVFTIALIVAFLSFIIIAGFGLGKAIIADKGYGESSSEEVNNNSNNNLHHVQPHNVDDYYRSDGTHVDGYWRGGLDGYYRTNPDGNPYNNLK